MSSRAPLINLWLSVARGEPQEAPRSPQGPPPHLQGATWKFSCACGWGWKIEHTDPDRRDGKWIDPVRDCLICHRAVSGRQID